MAFYQLLPASPESVTPLRRSLLSPLFWTCVMLLAFALEVWAQDQPIVTQIDVVGAKKVEEATVRFKLKTRVGDPYSPETVREDIKSLYTLGYFEDIVVHADIFEGGLKLIFVLQEKPSIQSIRIVGNKKLAEDKIKSKIDLVEGAIIPPGALLKNAEKIRLFYEEESYYLARVDASEERISPQEVTVTFTIVEGDKYDVGEIRIVGNKYLKEKDIKGKLQTTELFLWFFGGTLKREELRRDLDRIRAYYLDNGFLDIQVEEPEIQVNQEKKRLVILIRVEEGPQYRISQLNIKGNKLFSENDIRRLITSMPGGIFSREQLQADVVAITDRYAVQGYLFADAVPVTDIQRSDTTVSVSLEITEGQQAFINRIEIVGNTRTRDKVIRREILLVEGDVFNSALLRASRDNLQNLGFFEDPVKLETQRGTAPDKVNLVVDVKEKSTGAFTIGGGFSSTDGVLGVATISQTNLFGLGKRMSLAAQIGQNANRGNLEYVDPHFLDSDFLVNLRGFLTQTANQQTVQGFNADTVGGTVSAGHMLFERVFGTLGYTLEEVKIFDVALNAPTVILEQAAVNGGKSTVSEVVGTLLRDTRDNFIEPTRGNRTVLSGTYAGGFLGFDSDFYKLAADWSQYWPLWWKFVGHQRLNVLYGGAYGSTTALPAQERYFLGSINTIRGFKNFTISPKDQSGGLTGGNQAWFTNSEILFPLYPSLRMRGLVFFDAGNNLNENSSFVDLFQTRIYTAAGIGLRFQSPLGAIRLEWGFNLNPHPGEKTQVIAFSAGTSF